MIRKIIHKKLFIFLFIFASFFAYAQESEPHTSDDFEFSAQLAMAESDYMVTAGDVYQLVFNANGTAVNYSLIVDTSYKIRVSNLAIIDVRGLTYPALKKQVEEIVMKNFPLSGVQFVLSKPAVFYVKIQGEVKNTREVRSWGLSRLSTVLNNALTEYSSTRNVKITSANGKSKTYDLFQATRFGKLAQNPYVRPGDVITIGRRDRKVTVKGEVERPGTYELLKGENLKTLVTYYGGGLTELADTTRITLTRSRGGEEKSGNISYLAKSDIDSDFALNNGDSITISSISDLLPSVIVEGIIEVRNTDNDEEGVKQERPTDTSYSTSVKFHKGENYASFARRIKGMYTQYSDLENSYVERKGKRITLNIREFLDKADLKSEYNVESGDRIIIPYRQYLSKIIIDGEVTSVMEENAWPLRRLSTIISGNLTPYSSTRNVLVTSIDGSVRTYDLFKASRFGDIEQNPYILSGEKITVQRMERKVTINGQVERPGTYELTKEDNLKNLVSYYGGGLTELADTSRISLVRNRGTKDKAGELTYLSQNDIDSNLSLNNGDIITISSLEDLLPSVILEGIIEVRNTDNDEEGVKQERPTDTSYTVSVKFHTGENYATFVRRTRNYYTQYSDLENSYIERNGGRLSLNIREFLDKADLMSEHNVEAGDRIIIPYRQYLSKITIDGEVTTVMEENAWPLRRLSAIISGNLTPYSSTRKVTVTSIDGDEKTYDLFKASRFGEIEQNPYVLAGERITVGRMDRKVTINGQVERPGTYEIIEGDTLSSLIDYYGGGLTELADTSRITLVRSRGTEDKAGNLTYLSQEDIDAKMPLNNGDVITISSLADLLPSVIVEGIIEVKDTDNEEEGVKQNKPTDTSYSLSVKFHPGENYATFLRRVRNLYTQYSDLENSYFERNGMKIGLNIRKFLDKADLKSEYNVESSDRIIIPYRQYLSKIIIDGEVTSVMEENAWPLRRLSTIISGNLTRYSSTRNVMVTAIDGSVRTYDLFRATRFGEIEQNPYILSGEKITVGRIKRKITISGEVERPGTYELLDGENIQSLINYYGNGFTEFADSSRLEITRLVEDINNNNTIGRIIYLSEEDLKNDYKLNLYDTVHVPSLQELKTVAFIEGAIYVGEGTALEASNKKEIRITDGMNYGTLIRANKNLFGASSDLENAYIIRGEDHIPINMYDYLYDLSFYSALEVQPYDTLMIPFRQYFISVSGSVHNPGRYPYIPDRTYEYYIGLAGGFIRSQNTGKAVTITDMNGKKLSKNDFITPECTIEAKTNSFFFHFNQFSTFATTVLSVLTSVLSVLAIMKSTSGSLF